MTNIVNLVYICLVIIKAMNIVQFTQKTAGSLFHKEVAFNPHHELQNPVWYCLVSNDRTTEAKMVKPASYTSALKYATTYLSGAIGEGLKQSLQGYDINLEIILLYFRFYLIQMTKFVVSSPKRPGFDKYQEKMNGSSGVLKHDEHGTPLKFILQ